MYHFYCSICRIVTFQHWRLKQAAKAGSTKWCETLKSVDLTAFAGQQAPTASETSKSTGSLVQCVGEAGTFGIILTSSHHGIMDDIGDLL